MRLVLSPVSVTRLFLTIIVAAALSQTACVTLSRVHEPVTLPVVFQPIFLNCSPMDRDAVFTIKKSGARIFSSNMIWTVPDAHSAEIQFNSLLGDTILQVSRKRPKWYVSGSGQLEISEAINGNLSVNGFELPILAEEVGCILAGTWPVEWLQRLYLRDSSSQSLTMAGKDHYRRFEITMMIVSQPQSSRSDDIQSCASIQWGGFLGFMQHKVNVCREQSSDGLHVSLTGVNDYLIEWVIQNES